MGQRNKAANERTTTQGGGISSLQRPKGVPNQAKSHPGVSGRPTGPPRRVPPPPPGRSARTRQSIRTGAPAATRAPVATRPTGTGTRAEGISLDSPEFRNLSRPEQIKIERSMGGGPGSGRSNAELTRSPADASGAGGEQAINTRARVFREGGGVIPPAKIGANRAESVAGVTGREKPDDIRAQLGAARPQPPPPPRGADGEPGQAQYAPSVAEQEIAAREETAIQSGAPIDPETGQLMKPDDDGAFTDKETGAQLNPDGTPVVDPETGAPLNPEQALTQQIRQERGDTSPFMAAREAKVQKDLLRRKAPSEIEGVTQGHFEQVVNERQAAEIRLGGRPLSAMKQKEYTENARAQLREFGDYPGSEDPDSPSPPIRPMGRSFNPHTGKFTGESGPTAFDLNGFDMEAAKREFYRTGGRE